MRQNMSWALVVLALGFGFVSLANGQEGRPVGERPEASTRRTQPAEPESPATRGVPAQGNQAAAPRLVKVSGALTEFVRNSVNSSVEITFAVYKDEVGGEALWTETQSVEVDKDGRYTVLLGAAQADGVPVELFPAGEPRWLGVEIHGQAPQSRTLLVSVPYALKALDAEKLSGKSLSDFVLSESLGEQVRQVIQAQGQSAGQSTLAGAQQKQTDTSSTTTPQTSSPGPMFPPSTFSGTNSTQIVRVQQNGTGSGLVASTPSSTGASALVGLATSTSTSNSVFPNGVYGQNDGSGAGVAGIATNPAAGVGVYGQSATGFAGVFGNSVVNSGFAAGVFGTTSSPDGAGVHGANNSANGFATGVTGFSASANGNAVFGSASSTSGFANGVFGQTNSPGGSGVLGIENATTGFNSGVSGSSASPNGTGVFGSSFQWVGVGGQATAPSGGPAFGVWGDSLSTSGAGVAGFADATSGVTNGVYGESASPNGAGINGLASATTGFNNGVYGQTASDLGDAVHGDAVNPSGNAAGVFGTSVGTGGGIGVWGVSHATSGNSVGVRGDLESPTASGAAGLFLSFSPTGVPGEFVNFSGHGLLLQGLTGPFNSPLNQVFSVDVNGNLQISGNLTVNGTKSSTARLQSGREVALYAVESPENWFEDFGSAELKSGVAWVPLDASFAEATNAAVTYHVFLTPNGDSNGLYVARKTATGFEVREHGGGASNVAFDYRIVVKRRGYEAIRMAEVQHDTRTEDLSHQHFRSLNSSEITRRAGAMRKAPIIPATRPIIPRPVVPEVPRVNVPQGPKVKVPQPRQPR